MGTLFTTPELFPGVCNVSFLCFGGRTPRGLGVYGEEPSPRKEEGGGRGQGTCLAKRMK